MKKLVLLSILTTAFVAAPAVHAQMWRGQRLENRGAAMQNRGAWFGNHGYPRQAARLDRRGQRFEHRGERANTGIITILPEGGSGLRGQTSIPDRLGAGPKTITGPPTSPGPMAITVPRMDRRIMAPVGPAIAVLLRPHMDLAAGLMPTRARLRALGGLDPGPIIILLPLQPGQLGA